MFTKSSASLLIAVLGLTAGLTGSAQAASHAHASEASSALALSFIPIIPQMPTLPKQPNLVPAYPIQPSLTPSLRVFPAPRPQIAVSAVRAVAVTGDDDGCTTRHGKRLISVPAPTSPQTVAALAPECRDPENLRRILRHCWQQRELEPMTATSFSNAALAFSGDDDGCTTPPVKKPWRPTSPSRTLSIAGLA